MNNNSNKQMTCYYCAYPIDTNYYVWFNSEIQFCSNICHKEYSGCDWAEDIL